ncbi:MAG: 6-bladed beta-propeller [Leptolyngbya sp. PLA3]|nr:MAG: 6-bladed beta-propeller [Cyanobacteria bacterium CYA]MCE7968480.1 6-bladed beta-propeller [Leptolyngbya sp. PL-A3]
MATALSRRHFVGLSIAWGVCLRASARASRDDDQIIGHGPHRYRVVRGWGAADPAATPVRDCHEMVQTRDGRLFMFGNDTRNNMVIYNRDGRIVGAWGNEFPGGHGCTLSDENGEEFLFLTDPDRHQVFKTTLDGRVLLTLDAPLDADQYPDANNYRPTETAIGPNGDIYVADGYGSQYLIHYSPKGELKGVYAGPGSGEAQFNNMHGVSLDTRDKSNPTLLLTARAQNRFKRFSLDGRHLETIPTPGAWICRPVLHGDDLFFAVIISGLAQWQSNRSGFVAILDQRNRVVSCPGGHEPTYKDGSLQPLSQSRPNLFMHPHDVCVDRDGNLCVPQWNSGRTYPVRLERV